VLIATALQWMRRRFRKLAEEKPDLQRALPILDLPVSTAFALSILLIPSIYAQAPRLIITTVGTVTLIPPQLSGSWSDHILNDLTGVRTFQTPSKLIWQTASPKWEFDDATFDRSAATLDNPDHVAIAMACGCVVLHWSGCSGHRSVTGWL
jgi:hypothetical protein